MTANRYEVLVQGPGSPRRVRILARTAVGGVHMPMVVRTEGTNSTSNTDIYLPRVYT